MWTWVSPLCNYVFSLIIRYYTIFSLWYWNSEILTNIFRSTFFIIAVGNGFIFRSLEKVLLKPHYRVSSPKPCHISWIEALALCNPENSTDKFWSTSCQCCYLFQCIPVFFRIYFKRRIQNSVEHLRWTFLRNS